MLAVGDSDALIRIFLVSTVESVPSIRGYVRRYALTATLLPVISGVQLALHQAVRSVALQRPLLTPHNKIRKD